MFNVEKVSKRIREARIRKNMTQNHLADELGVSYQAVSNWERGNSMPDISKYEDLCRILDVNLEFLLGFGSDTNTVNKLLGNADVKGGNVSVQELIQVAPMLPPEELKEKVEKCIEEEAIDINSVIALAPFLDPMTLGKMAETVTHGSMDHLIALSPFLISDTFPRLIDKWNISEGTMGHLIALAPFLDQKALDGLAANVVPYSIEELTGIAPFVSQERLSELFGRVENQDQIPVGAVMGLLPFLSREAIAQIADKIDITNINQIVALTPWFSSEELERILRNISISN